MKLFLHNMILIAYLMILTTMDPSIPVEIINKTNKVIFTELAIGGGPLMSQCTKLKNGETLSGR